MGLFPRWRFGFVWARNTLLRHHPALFCLLLFGLSLIAVPQPAAGQTRWLTGAALERQRQQPVTRNWAGVPVRKGLSQLARLQQVAILLDRRIDPERTVELPVHQVGLDDLLNQIAEKMDGAATWLGPVAYVGPRRAALRLRTLAALRAADVRALPNDARGVFLEGKSWHWDELAEPRELLTGLAAEANVKLHGLDLLPHDLWPAADLPSLSWIDRLTLLANEFDLTYEIVDASNVRLVSIAEPVLIERSYPAAKQGEELAARFKGLAPDAQIAIARGKVIVRGRLEDHERLKAPKPTPAAAATGTNRPGKTLYTLTVPDQPLAAVLEKLRASSIEITVDEAALQQAGLSIDRRVSFSVERVTLEELLSAALKPAGLTFRRQGNAYRIIPAPSN